MLVIETIEELKEVLFRVKSSGKTIGFVPTMGALHAGHYSLLKQAKMENTAVVCSIFVNPTQFNDQNDFAHYPRTLTHDLEYINEVADIVFVPKREEVYPSLPSERYNFGILESVMEGHYRSNHFNGVATIVKRLFDWIMPDKAYFGEKDYQQLVIIKELVRQFGMPIEIIASPTVREENGLAMSSRNKLLSAEEFEIAGNIYRILQDSLLQSPLSVETIKHFVQKEIDNIQEFRLEYFEIVDGKTLQSIAHLDNSEVVVGCIAVYLGNVRLIDNIKIKNSSTCK